MAGLYQTQGEYDKALSLFLFQKTLVILEKVSGTQHLEVAISLSNLAKAYQAQGDYEKALSLSQRASSIREKVLGTEHPDVAANLNHLAELYRIQGKYNKARPLYERALKIAREKLGKTHPETQIYMMNYLTLLEEIDKSQEKHGTIISKIKHFFTE